MPPVVGAAWTKSFLGREADGGFLTQLAGKNRCNSENSGSVSLPDASCTWLGSAGRKVAT